MFIRMLRGRWPQLIMQVLLGIVIGVAVVEWPILGVVALGLYGIHWIMEWQKRSTKALFQSRHSGVLAYIRWLLNP